MSDILKKYAMGGVNRPNSGGRMTTMSGPPAGAMTGGAHGVYNGAKKSSGGNSGGNNGGGQGPSLSDWDLVQQLMASLSSTGKP